VLITVIGTGYVGLVTGTCFAETGNKVTCVDIDKAKVEKLSSGQISIYEPDLEKIFLKNSKEGRLVFTTNLEEVLEAAEIIFLALPTPPGANGSADLKYVLGVADQMGKLMKGYKVVVNKSTVPVGTADKVREAIAKNYKGEFDVVSNPEFLREGVAVDDFMNPDRVVIGTKSMQAKKVMTELYAPFVREGNPLIFMDERSSELTKYAANSFLATKISFMNEIAQLCERLGADVDMVRKGVGSDDRIGKRFLFPGIGYGGSCFPKDVQALVHSAAEVNYDFKILKAVEDVNYDQKKALLPKIDSHYGEIKGKTVSMWGLAFKPNTDDIREAPSLEIIDSLLQRGAKVQCYDPEAIPNVQRVLGNSVVFSENMYDVLEGADFLVITTEWPEFRTPDFARIEGLLTEKVIFDGRNIFELDTMRKHGYIYYSIGRKDIK
jgi:UDPglucose 6-dehydrogenase